MKASELSSMTVEQLEDKVKELKSELFGLRFQLATGQLQNTMRLSEVKRDIARCKTILRQKDGARPSFVRRMRPENGKGGSWNHGRKRTA